MNTGFRILRRSFFALITVLLIPGHIAAATISSALASRETVGPAGPNRFVTPVSQILTPAGVQAPLPDLRPQGLALSPDGRRLITSGKTAELLVLNPITGDVIQRVGLPAEGAAHDSLEPVSTHLLKPDTHGQLSFTGLIFSKDGKRVYLSNVNGSIKVFSVDEVAVQPWRTFHLPPVAMARRTNEIPAGLRMSADGTKLYVALNLSNGLLEMDANTGTVLRRFEVGMAPYEVVLVGRKAYVSNWGGRRPETNSLTGPGGQGTLVRVDPRRHIASEGSVSIVDLEGREATQEILTGLHASALLVHPSQRHVLVANAGSDTVSVIDVQKQHVVQEISLRWQPKDYFGASPNAMTFDAEGKRLFVCNGTQNAVAVLDFSASRTKLRGLIPVGWYPGAICFDASRGLLQVANIKGTGSGRRGLPSPPPSFNSHDYVGSISIVKAPDKAELVRYTRTVLANCRRELIETAQLPARPNQPPRPVPERVGEPSVFHHVVYVIKENRTYDQVLGDVPQGNGDPRLCMFGEFYTPNQHKMVREFTLMDNIYCAGILSADGHQWSTTAFATDYMEKSFAGFPRSYPDGMEDDDVDAMAYSPAGFLWDNVLEHGKTFRDYGEFAIEVSGWNEPRGRKAPRWTDFYNDFIRGENHTYMRSRPAIESIRPYLNTNTVGWSMKVPDVYRAARFIEDLARFERAGTMPHLSIICLPNDHTSGTSAGSPTPGAYVADNDLAFGRIVDAISHSAFWKDTAIFAIEDDPQAGQDHVSGYRTTGYVVSPYTKRRTTVSTQFNTPGMIHTMELILGLPPMNQMDAAATPLSDCFTSTPDFTPFTAVTNNVPLDQLNPPSKALLDPVLRRDAELSERLPLDKPDQCDEDLLNKIIWHAQRGSKVPYPSWAVIPKRLRKERD